MNPDTTDNTDEIDHPLSAPESLFDHDGIESEQVLRAQDQSHFDTRREVAGFAIVGITNDSGDVLLASSTDGEWWRLPHARVERNEDYCEVITNAVKDQFTIRIEIDRVVHVRQFDAVLEDSPAADLAERSTDRDELAEFDGYTASFDVLLEATIIPDGESPTPPVETDSDATVEWFSSIPDGAPGGLPGEDLRRFVG